MLTRFCWKNYAVIRCFYHKIIIYIRLNRYQQNILYHNKLGNLRYIYIYIHNMNGNDNLPCWTQ